MNTTIAVLSPQQALTSTDTFRQRFAAGSSQRDRERRLPREEITELKQSGLLALRVPRAFGGAEIDMVTFSRVLRLLAAGDPNIVQAVAPQFTNLEKLRLYTAAPISKRIISPTPSPAG